MIIFQSDDGRQLLFKTDGFHLSDMLMHLNRLLGLPALGLRGAPEGEEEAEGVDERLLEVIEENIGHLL